MYRKILLAYDGSTFSASALKQSAELAKLTQAELHLLSIAVTSGGMAISEAAGATDVWGHEEQALDKEVAAAVAALNELHVSVITTIRYGDPAIEIAAYANQIQADLVVLGYARRGILSRWFQGSVSAKLLDHLPCSLLVATGSS